MEVMKLGEGVKWMEGGGGGERCNSVMQLKYFANQERCRGAKVQYKGRLGSFTEVNILYFSEMFPSGRRKERGDAI